MNNAGIRKYEKVDEASWTEILSLTLMRSVSCAKATVPLLRRGSGAQLSMWPLFGRSSLAVGTCL